MDGGLNREALNRNTRVAHGCAAKRQGTNHGDMYTEAVDITGNFHYRILRQISDNSLVDHIEMSPIDTIRF